jgi:hypothetical protein
MDGRAELLIAGDHGDLDMIAARSAGIWIGLALDDSVHVALKRDGLDPATLRLSGPHPFDFAAAPDGGIRVTARASNDVGAEALLDLFRVNFLRRLFG